MTTISQMTDLISRQATIDAVDEWFRLYAINRTMSSVTSIQDVLRNLPSAQPEHSEGLYVDGFNDGYRDRMKDELLSWIPCSERLPEEKKEVLISAENELYIAELEIINDREYWSEVMEYRYIENVEAWMPLPEPYRKDGD